MCTLWIHPLTLWSSPGDEPLGCSVPGYALFLFRFQTLSWEAPLIKDVFNMEMPLTEEELLGAHSRQVLLFRDPSEHRVDIGQLSVQHC